MRYFLSPSARLSDLGEAVGHVSQKVAWASKAQFNAEPHPRVWSVLKAGDKSTSLVLTKLPTISGSDSQ